MIVTLRIPDQDMVTSAASCAVRHQKHHGQTQTMTHKGVPSGDGRRHTFVSHVTGRGNIVVEHLEVEGDDEPWSMEELCMDTSR